MTDSPVKLSAEEKKVKLHTLAAAAIHTDLRDYPWMDLPDKLAKKVHALLPKEHR